MLRMGLTALFGGVDYYTSRQARMALTVSS